MKKSRFLNPGSFDFVESFFFFLKTPQYCVLSRIADFFGPLYVKRR
jgi:hypothetical protein